MLTSRTLLVLALPLLCSTCSCGRQTRAGECASVARTVNARLERIESAYRSVPQDKVQWSEISKLYKSLAEDLKQRRLEDARLRALMSEYTLLMDVASRDAQSVADGLKNGTQDSVQRALTLLHQQAQQHSRLTERIDRHCRSQ
jgi:hypothetical protein